MKIFCFTECFVSLTFVSPSYDIITSSQIIAESSIILAKYFPFSQLHVAGFQIQSFWHILCFSHLHWNLLLFHHWLELHLFHQVYVFIHMIYDLLMSLVHLFL